MSAPAERDAAAGSWAEVRAHLEALGFHPSRKLGQNFLVDRNLARAIVRDARVEAGDFVLEVGPGCGVLSRELAALGVRLLAVEIDRRLVDVARQALAPFPQASVLRADVLAGKHALAPEVLELLPRSGAWHVVANLPYSAGTPFVVVASRLACPPQSLTVLLQSELVERLAAAPGGRTWGPVGAKLRNVYEVAVLRRVAPELFWPRPQVDSALVRLELRADRSEPAGLPAYDRLVDWLFQARRKTLGSRLAEVLGDRQTALDRLAELGLDPRARPETLGVDTLRALTRALGRG